jgi:LacI family transcriptional regulator
MDKPALTLQHIAQATGVSKMTVSMALRNHPRIAAATRARIQAQAAAMGYRPDPRLGELMLHMRTSGRSRPPITVAYLVSHEPDSPWQSGYLGAMYEGARRRAEMFGYKLDILYLNEPGMTLRRMSNILRSRGIEGVLVAPLPLGGGHLNLDLANLSVAHVGATLWLPKLHRAHHDYHHGVMLLMRNLVRRGYRRIGLVTSFSLARTTEHQEEAAFLYYAMRLRQAPIPILMFRSWEPATFLTWFHKHRPDAIVTCYLEARPALESAGLRIPEDVGLALNWIPEVSMYAGIQQDFGAAGAAGFDLVEGQLHRHEHGIPAQPKTVLILGHWVEGTTVRPMPSPEQVFADAATPMSRR